MTSGEDVIKCVEDPT